MQAELGISLYEYVRGDRPWTQLYRFLTLLPKYGHFYASLMDDEDTVARILKQQDDNEEEEQKESSFGIAGWTPERELLTLIAEQLAEMHATLIQVHSKDANRPNTRPLPRPKTAAVRVEARLLREAHAARVKMFLPGG